MTLTSLPTRIDEYPTSERQALDHCSELGVLAPIGLDELNERAALQTRVDRKYLVPLTETPHLVRAVAGVAAALEIDGRRDFAYASLYFDTPDLVSYRLAAHRRRRRFKIRTRTYVDTASCWLEVKTRGGRASTVKQRVPYLLEHHASIQPGLSFVEQTLAAAEIPHAPGLDLRPTLATTYRRSTLFFPRSCSRATIDTDLVWEDGVGGRLRLRSYAVVETKTGSTPSSTDRLLWRHGVRPVRLSKYGTGMAALHTDLPATPWRRVLDRHVVRAAS